MDLNPYDSPTTQLSVATQAVRVEPCEHRFGPILMAIIGVFVGPPWAGVCGAVAAGCLGACRMALLPDRDGFGLIQNIFGIAFMGAFCGLLAGAAIGPLIGIVVGLTRRTHWRRLAIIGAVLSLIAGGGFGTLGGTMLSGTNSLATILLGGVLGSLAGLLGGGGLGLILSRIDWGPPVLEPLAARPVGVDSTPGFNDTSG